MSIEAVVTRTTNVVATCDNCGETRSWVEPGDGDEAYSLGFVMSDPRMDTYAAKTLWFHEAACVHEWIDRAIINGVPNDVRTVA